MASKGNATTKSSSKPSDPSTTSYTLNTVEKCEEIEESQEQTNSADPSVLPRTSRHTSKEWDNFTRKRVGEEIKVECTHCLKQLAGGPRKVLEKNDVGEHFPILAICLGYELLTMIITKVMKVYGRI
ncbi:hypothetical protein RND71_037947 [Anisodus tanguticus]|uniref:Uncharacterized protein n=1 Tax=Anisodus tanguticus TaxID=243964 RepID=A0AAE1UWJ3_9SOLA|nr:hypothetical protein RND71_037947 [Anisodus tanguticus]